MGEYIKSYVDPNDMCQYVDETEKPNIILKLSENRLFVRLGMANFLIETRGYYDPNVILEIYWVDKGKEVLKKYAPLIKSKVCEHYNAMKESGLLDTIDEVYFFIMGMLIMKDIHRAVAACIAALIAKQGLYSFCKDT